LWTRTRPPSSADIAMPNSGQGVVIDASATVDLLLGIEPNAGQLQQRLRRPTLSLHAPHLLDLEVLHTLRRYERRGIVSAQRVAQARQVLTSLRLTRYSHAALGERIWALRHTLTAYDAAYVALAEGLNLPLLTSDGQLARASGHTAHIECVGQ